MACVVVTIAQAIAVSIASKAVKANENKTEEIKVSLGENNTSKPEKISFARKLKWLANMLWGGSALLVFEHIWHGEISPQFPFLTAASDAAGTAAMLREMATTGVGMALAVSTVWLLMLGFAALIEKKAAKADEPQNEAAQ